MMSDQDRIAKYRRGWTGGLPETPCGYGSKLKNTVKQRAYISEIIERYGIGTIADIGAGDMNWIHKTDLKGAKYTAYDLVPRRPGVEKFDLVNEIPPPVDLILCFWVLNHLTIEECRKAIHNLKLSNSTYMLMTFVDRYADDLPKEINMPYIDDIYLNEIQGSIRLIEL